MTWSGAVLHAELTGCRTIKTALGQSGRRLEKLFCSCRAIVGHFNKSAPASHALEEQQRVQGSTKPLKVVQDVATRWNSQYYMVVQLLQLRTPITVVLAQDKKNRNLNLSPEQWSLAEDLVDVLLDLEVVTTRLSGEQYRSTRPYLCCCCC